MNTIEIYKLHISSFALNVNDAKMLLYCIRIKAYALARLDIMHITGYSLLLERAC
jgi:hypothetical protein